MAKKQSKEPIKPMSLGQMQMSTERLLEFIQSQNFGSIEEINEFLSKNVTGKRIDEVLPAAAPSFSNQQKANDLMYDVYDCAPAKGKKLAKDALKLDPENVRALNYLAQQEKSADSALKLYCIKNTRMKNLLFGCSIMPCIYLPQREQPRKPTKL